MISGSENSYTEIEKGKSFTSILSHLMSDNMR